MVDDISLLDVIKEGGYEASLITTFNANLLFYEEVVLRRLVAAGCQQNVVLMDQAQCAASWASEATRPKLAGAAYSLVPLKVAGAFHPKVCILVGRKKATILVGSHNLTLSGFGYNREICNRINVHGAADSEGRAVLDLAWRMIVEWIECGGADLPKSLLESVFSFSTYVSLLSKKGMLTGPIILHQHTGGISLFDQVRKLVTGTVRRIGVIGAFFDRDLAFVERLTQQWPHAEVVVAIDPDTVHLPQVNDVRARFVDARLLWSAIDERDKYLHAKALYFEQVDDNGRLFISGSANPSRPAWMLQGSANIEAVVVRQGPEAQSVAEKLHLSDMFSLTALTEDELQATVARTVAEIPNAPPDSGRLFVGVAVGEDKLLVESGLAGLQVDRITLLSGEQDVLQADSSVQRLDSSVFISVSIDVKRVRSCELYFKGAKVGRVMVEHPQMLAAVIKPSNRQIRDALGAMDPTGEDISAMLKAVENALFDTANEQQVESEIRFRRGSSSVASRGDRPSSLEVSVQQLASKPTGRRRLVESSDLVTLIDLLSRKVGQEFRESVSVPVDSAGRTEEEQIGEEDSSDESAPDNIDGKSVDEAVPTQALEDARIAELVSNKVKRLVRKMLTKLVQANSEEQKGRVVIQLIAVLSLIKELWRIERLPRWRTARGVLVPDDSRRVLLDQALSSLFGSKTRFINILSEEGSECEEAVHLRILLLWLAWTVRDAAPEIIEDRSNLDTQQKLSKSKAMFIALTPAIAGDQAAYCQLDAFIKARVQNPQAVDRADVWIRRIIEFAEFWGRDLIESPELEIGGCCYAGECNYPLVVSRISGNIVHFWDHGGNLRSFLKSAVIPVQPGPPSPCALADAL